MGTDTLAAVRGKFSIEDPWRGPANGEVVRLRRATDGEPPRLATTVQVYYDDEHLTFVFSAADDHVVATYTEQDDPLYEEDVVEVFLAPERIVSYFEIEVSPIGTVFDARIHSPAGERSTMTVDLGWGAEATVAVRRTVERGGAMSIDTLLRVPFRAVGREAPRPGERWRANVFRIDRHPVHGDEYSAWRPTLRNPPDFHVPEAFGTLEFHS